MYSRDLGDATSELSYYLVENGKEDSTLLTTSWIHDMTAPGFWWTRDSKRLVYEHKQEGDSISINVYDTTLGSVVLSTTGYINEPAKRIGIYFDPLKNVILYYQSIEPRKVRMLILNVSNLETVLIGEFENWDDHETVKLMKFDKTTGEINVVVKGPGYRNKIVVLNAGHVHYGKQEGSMDR